MKVLLKLFSQEIRELKRSHTSKKGDVQSVIEFDKSIDKNMEMIRRQIEQNKEKTKNISADKFDIFH